MSQLTIMILSSVSLVSSVYHSPEILRQLAEFTELQPLPQVSVPLTGGQEVLLVEMTDWRLEVPAIRTEVLFSLEFLVVFKV